ncbi:hypothetical protein VMCG_05802 [Cytospora schulzeri]|uniref:Transcription factor domain-containing protein n=1 Tax=Cytospora schulzeri TaxID=448051 RepID=A0A423WID1_9PEZI|nr:hypothetical protein VMCG_05802 [Valsa malicola]
MSGLTIFVQVGGHWSAPAARYYGESLRLLIQNLECSQGSKASGDVLTANLLLSSFEMLEAHTHEHQRHLDGALTLIRVHGINSQGQKMDRVNFWIYVRHDITIAIENESPLRLHPEKWEMDLDRHIGHLEEDGDIDVLSNRLLWLVARAINLIYAADPPSSSGGLLQNIHGDAADWLERLPVSYQGVKYGQADDLGFSRKYFANPSAGECICIGIGAGQLDF